MIDEIHLPGEVSQAQLGAQVIPPSEILMRTSEQPGGTLPNDHVVQMISGIVLHAH